MKILSISTQKPHSTGSGVYLTELVKSFDRAGHEQAVVAGVYEEDLFEFPPSVRTYQSTIHMGILEAIYRLRCLACQMLCHTLVRYTIPSLMIWQS